MIPIQLTLEGVYSYQKKQMIDFNPLTQAKLFGVFGNVGSGKSTIIEAIVFAIYGETDRLKKSGDDRLYNMMNLKSDNMLIDFECFTGKEGKEKYRFVYTARRNSKKFDSISKHERVVYKEVNGEWVPQESMDATQIIGMDYKNFNRTIIIPQGKFKDFIGLGPTDRARMLKELFGLEQFELFNKTKEIYGESKGQFDTKSELIKRFELISDESLKETQTKQKELIHVLKEQEIVLTKERKQLETLNKTKEQIAQKKQLEADLKLLMERKPVFDERKERLELFGKVFANFNDKLIQLKQKEQELITKKGDLQLVINQRKEAEAELKEVFELEKAIVEKVGNKAKAEQNIQDLNTILSIIDLDKKMVYFQQSFMQLQEQVNKAHEKEVLTKKRNEEISSAIDELKKNRIDITVLKDIEKWYESCSLLKSDVEKYKKSLDEKRGKLEYLNTQKDEIVKQFELFNQMDEIPSFEECLNNSSMTFEEIERDYLIIQQKIMRLQAKQEIAAVSSALKDGEECPLCGSLEHPNPSTAHSYEKELKELEDKKIVVDQKMRSLRKVKEELDKVYVEYQSVSGVVVEQTGLEEELVRRLQSHYDLFAWKDYSKDNPEKLQKDLAQYSQQQKKLEALDVELKEGFKSFDQLKLSEDQLKEQLKHVEIELKGMEGLVKDKLSELENPQFAALRDKDKSIVEASLKKGMEFLRQLEQIEQKKIDSDKHIAALIATIENEEKQFALIEKSITQHKESIDQLIQKENYETIAFVEEVLSWKLNQDEEKQMIEQFFNQYQQTNERLNLIQEQLKGIEFDVANLNELSEKVQNLEAQKSELEKQLGSIENEINSISEQLKEKAQLTVEIEKLGIRLDNIKVLLDLFKSSGFVQYISSIFLKNLVISANHRFLKLTNNSLSLELDEKNQFIVRDFMNEGKTRLLKTLSGGQTFQASLCLALSLAENVKSLNQSEQSFFFLDEGFGSLDKTSLGVVLDTLKSLEKENRIVGVISHVEELKQDMGVSVQVTNDEETGSSIKYSWE